MRRWWPEEGDSAQAADEILAFTKDPRLSDRAVPDGQLRFRRSLMQDLRAVGSNREAEIIDAYVRLKVMAIVLLDFIRPTLDKQARLRSIFGDEGRPAMERQAAAKQLSEGPDSRLLDQFAYTLGDGTIAGFAGGDTKQTARDGHLRKGYKQIAKYLPKGIITLPLPLVIGLVRAGLKWGGEWGESKDPMHFEDPARDRETCRKALSLLKTTR